jgi:hypothetical protein
MLLLMVISPKMYGNPDVRIVPEIKRNIFVVKKKFSNLFDS